jgi:translation initiation factor IF-3
MARDLDLDLVEVADKADPPVCRIMDYGKYKYEQSQRAKESRKKSTHVLVKEMKYRPKIGPGDFVTKTKKVEQFLGDGSKVKVTIMFRGREMQHPELGRRILDRVAEAVEHVGRVETYPKQEGRNMTMLLGPGQATRRQREEAVARVTAETEAKAAAAEAAAAEAAAAEAAAAEATDAPAATVAPETPSETPSETPTETPTETPVEKAAEAS